MDNPCCTTAEGKEEIEQVVKFLKLIAEENRLKILCMLKKGTSCVCEIWPALELPQNLASHHLKALKDLDLIESNKEGLRVYYTLKPEQIHHYMTLLNQLFV